MRNVKNKIGNHIGEMLIEEKMIALAGLLAVVGCFFSWSSWTVADVLYSDNGFNGKTWLIGWLITVFSALSILMAMLPNTESLIRKFGFGRMTLVFFLGLEGVFLAVIGISVLGYSEYLTQELGNGVFITLLGTAFIALGGFLGMRRGNSALRTKANPQGDFLQFQEPKREHNLHEVDNDILSPEEEDEMMEEEDDQQSLNLD